MLGERAMKRKRELGDVAEAVTLPGDRALASRADTPPARRHFTRLDQVAQLVGVSEADPELGYIARLLALCSLPRTNPGNNRLQYVRRNGPYTLVMSCASTTKLPYGPLPRLLLALGHDGGGSHAKPRARARRFALGVHAETRTRKQRRRGPDSVCEIRWTGYSTQRYR